MFSGFFFYLGYLGYQLVFFDLQLLCVIVQYGFYRQGMRRGYRCVGQSIKGKICFGSKQVDMFDIDILGLFFRFMKVKFSKLL